MVANKNENDYELISFSGLRDASDPERFDLEDMELAVNVDIDDTGHVKRRKGHSTALASGNFRSLWSDGLVCYAVKDDTTLVRILTDWSTQTMVSGLASGRDMSYVRIGGGVAYSNGKDTGVLTYDGRRTWGIAPPTTQPTATPSTGDLKAGRYQYAVAFVRTDGQISGSPEAGLVDVVKGGISFTDVPVSADPDVSLIYLYMSRTDGEGLYHVGSYSNGTTDFHIRNTSGTSLHSMWTQFMQDAPAGEYIDIFSSHVLVASGDTLYYSEGFAHELFDIRKNYRFPNPITLMIPMQNGVYLGTSEEFYWLDGKDPAEWSLRNKFSYGAIPGTGYKTSRDKLFKGEGSGPASVFHSTEGVCVALEGGEIRNITQERFTIPAQQKGAGVVRLARGVMQYVSTLQGTGGTQANTAVGAGSLPPKEITA